MSDFLVKRDDLRECRIAESEAPEVGPGEALLRVDSFGLTANNVTYAVMGEAMSYWDFFPAEDGWGRVPVWGFAEVESSEAEGVEPGTRVYGYLPPSSHLLVTPVSVGGQGFVDGSPHRAALPSAYHRYLASGADAFYRADTEAIQMLLRPLFFTSFLIDDQLADEGLTERGPILISSASSKTAIAAAFLLARREGVELVGLTSPRNARVRRGPRASTAAPSPTRRSTRSSAGPPPTSTSPATAECGGRSTRTSATSWPTAWPSGSPTGRSWAPERASCPGPRRPSSSPPTGSSSAPRTGAVPASSSGSPRPGTRSASGSPAGWRRSPARASRGSRAPISRSSRAASTRSTAHVISLAG